jgi:quercetin dioxygenase-like cupin family protein
VQSAWPMATRTHLLSAAIEPEKSIARIEIKEVTLPRRMKAPLHLHPCPVAGVVTEGIIAFQLEGGAVQHLRRGDAFLEPANVRVSRFDNDGDGVARFTAVYLLGDDEHELIRLLPD